VPRMRDIVGVIFLVEGDGCLGPSELCQGDEGMDGIHLLLNDATLPMGLIRLGAPKVMSKRSALGNSLSSS
jgi:hypothetical protein